LAAKEGHVELCEHLVENGALPGVTTNVNNDINNNIAIKQQQQQQQIQNKTR